MPRGNHPTRCPYGHPYDEANTYRNPRTGQRACRTCRRLSSAGVRRVPGRGEAMRRARDLMATHGPEIARRYMAGENLLPLASEFGVTQQTIANAVRLNGGTIRPKGDRTGDYQRGPKNHGWKGGRILKDGYWMVRLSEGDEAFRSMVQVRGYVAEHRLVMARAIGRPLESDETVHHIDGNRQNNQLSNLQLRLGQHGKGVSLRCRDCGSQNIRPVPIGG